MFWHNFWKKESNYNKDKVLKTLNKIDKQILMKLTNK